MPTLPTGLQLTNLDENFRNNSKDVLEAVRSKCPVYRDVQTGGFWITRYPDARGLLTDRQIFRDPDRAEPGAKLMHSFKRPEDDLAQHNFLFMDPPDHGRIRDPLAKALNHRLETSLGLIAEIASRQASRLEHRTEFDLVTEYSVPMVTEVIARLVGVADLDLQQFKVWSESLTRFTHPSLTDEDIQNLTRDYEALSAYLDERLNESRLIPNESIISDLTALQRTGYPLTDREIRYGLIALLVGGNITTSDLIASVVWLLLRNPDQLQNVRRQPSLIPAAIEEALRLEPPVELTSRVAREPMDLGNDQVAAGSALHILIQAANCDPDIYPQPHEFQIDRKARPHLAFGGGAHYCIGASLARIETKIAVEILLARFQDLAMDEASPVQWAVRPFFHGLERLHLNVRAASDGSPTAS